MTKKKQLTTKIFCMKPALYMGKVYLEVNFSLVFVFLFTHIVLCFFVEAT